MKDLFKICGLVIALLLLASCNKTDIDFPYQKNLTVESFIEEGKQARVYLTYNFPIDELVDSIALTNSIETKAKVTLSYNGIDEILILKRDNSHYPMLYYQSNMIIGTANTDYNLDIIADKEDYHSNTYMPENFRISSFIFENLSGNDVNKRDLYITIDNPNPNQIAYFNLLIKDSSQSAKYKFTNRGLFTNSTAVDSEFLIFVPYPETESKSSFVKGDSIYIQLQSITQNEYEFWKSIYGDATNVVDIKGVDESTPSNVENAFGFFGGRSVSTYQIVIK